MTTRKQETKKDAREQTPRSEDPARLNDLNADQTPEKGEPPTRQGDQSKQSGVRDPHVEKGKPNPQGNTPHNQDSDKPTNPPHPQNDGTMTVQDTSREGNPSFVESGVTGGGQEGAFGEDEYKDRRNEKPVTQEPQKTSKKPDQ